MLAQPVAQRGVEQMGRGVIGPQARTPRAIDYQARGIAQRDAPLDQPAEMDVQSPSFFWVSVTSSSAPSALRMAPLSPIWPPDSP